ncbi:MAG: hypothetical protein LBQ23_02345 [Puniceicoccales bacterium]|nr:hypothetical protein [Puniceicoccales bacterium]
MCLLLITTDVNCEPIIRGTKKHDAIIKNVSVRQFDDGAFKIIGEYFGNKKENQSFRCIARDDESTRTGTYFMLGEINSLQNFPGKHLLKFTSSCLSRKAYSRSSAGFPTIISMLS